MALIEFDLARRNRRKKLKLGHLARASAKSWQIENQQFVQSRPTAAVGRAAGKMKVLSHGHASKSMAGGRQRSQLDPTAALQVIGFVLGESFRLAALPSGHHDEISIHGISDTASGRRQRRRGRPRVSGRIITIYVMMIDVIDRSIRTTADGVDTAIGRDHGELISSRGQRSTLRPAIACREAAGWHAVD
jgi:hypothetical protein